MVTIAAGESSANFTLTVVDDTLLDASQPVTVIATASGFDSGADTITVLDNDTVNLSLGLAAPSISEGGGNTSVVATVTRDGLINQSLTVQLSASNPERVTLPSSLLIPAGATSATFTVNAVDNADLTGNQTITLTATPTTAGTNVPLPGRAASIALEVLDNESPGLSLSLDRDLISETGTATAEVTRNGDTSAPITMSIWRPAILEKPPSQIRWRLLLGKAPQPSLSAAWMMASVMAASQSSLALRPAGLNADVAAIEVTDIEVPDLVITDLAANSPAYTDQQAQFTYKVENRGLQNLSSTWTDRVYLSTDNQLDENDQLLTEFDITANIQVGQFYEYDVSYFNPRTPGEYFLIATTDANGAVNEGTGLGENNNTVIAPFTVVPAYSAEVSTDVELGVTGQSIVLQGNARSNADNSPVPFEFVTIEVENNGFTRQLDGFTDANGNFIRSFTPLANEAGTFNIRAFFPDNENEDTGFEDSFKILGATFGTDKASHQVVADAPFTAAVSLNNLTDTVLTGFTYSVESLPENWDVQVNLPTTLVGDGTNTVDYTITAPNESLITQDTFTINLTSAEGVTASLPVSVDLQRFVPQLAADTTLLTSGMLRGEQTFVEVELTNEGGATANDIQVLLPDAPWLSLATTDTIESLAPGESTNVTLALTPDASLDLTEYTGNILFDAEGNDGDLSLGFNFRAVSDATGDLSVNVINELFYFAEGAPKLDNATAVLRDYFTGEEVGRLTTDETGMVNFDDLAEGYYTLEVRAEDHDTFRQTVEINAGETETIDSFLSKQTVKYTWTVTETEIQDQYNISVESVFETDVPIPTVVVDPPVIDVGDLDIVGQVTQLDLTFTNHGLIAANDIQLNFGSHPFYQIEPLLDEIGSLDAKSSITVPVRITRIADFDSLGTSGGEFSASSTPSVPCGIPAGFIYTYICADQDIQRLSAIAVNGVEGNCPPGLPGGGGAGPGGSVGPGDGGVRTNPVIIQPVDFDCTPCLELSKTIDLSYLFEPIAEIAEAAVDGYLATTAIGKLADVELDADASVKLTTCCDSFFGFKFEAEANTAAGVTFGGSKEVSLGASLEIPEGELSSEGSGSVTAEAAFNAKLGGFAVKECDDGLDAALTGSLSFDFNTSLQGSATLGFTPNTLGIELGFDPSVGINAEVVGGLFGSISYSFEWSVSKGFSDCFKTTGLYLEAFAEGDITGLGSIKLSPFDDKATTEVETRKYLLGYEGIDNVCLDDLEPSSFLASSGESIVFNSLSPNPTEAEITEYIAGIQAEFLEDLRQQAQQLIEDVQQPGEPSTEPSVCAQVRISIDQEAVMTRSAFLGELIIENTSDTISLEDISVNLEVRDENGNVVNELFGITDPILENLNAVDGSGLLGTNSIGSAEWTFIPSTNATTSEEPVQYSIGGTLSYEQDGQLITVPLLSTPVTVYPQAELYLDYFQERNVYGDDPFTEATEISEPFSLGVLVQNKGFGAANDLSITSAQPKIIENEKGLLIDFDIIGSQVNNEAVTPSLSADFGTIGAGETAVADWLLKSSLQGKFIEYDATFEHVNDLGVEELSLIKEVNIHELIRKVQVDHPTDDNLPDFLVNGEFDANFDPDTLYFSDGTTAPVIAIDTATVDAPVSIFDLEAAITTNATPGWSYHRLLDPADGQFSIETILRSDGTELDPANVWRTDRTFPATGRPIYENVLHFLDKDSTGSYTIIYDSDDDAPPQVREIVDIAPDPRNTPVDSLEVVFTEAILASTFDYQDLTLTLDGGANLITSGVTINQTAPNAFEIQNLTGVTGNVGQYQFSIDATGIQDLSGNAGAGTVNETWVFTGDRPAVAAVDGFTSNMLTEPIDSFEVTFTEAIVPGSFDYTDISLTRNEGGNLLNDTVTITQLDSTTFEVGNLSGFTGIEGDYELLVTANDVQDEDGNSGVGGKGFTWVLDTTAPTLTAIDNLDNRPRNTPIGSLEVSFDQAIAPESFTIQALSLTRDGGPNLITNAVTIEKRNETTYIIKGLNGLQTEDGDYILAVDGAGITDVAGNPAPNTLTTAWTLDTVAPPAAINIEVSTTPTTSELSTASTALAPLNDYGQYRVNSTQITLTGDLPEPNLRIYVKDATTNESLGQATVNGTQFTADVILSGAGSRTLALDIVDQAGNRTTGTVDIFADLTQPTILELLNVPTAGNTDPVDFLDVVFSELLDLATFDATDLALTRDGGDNLITDVVTIEYLSGTTYRISGLTDLTNTPGTYRLSIDTTTLTDRAGNPGFETEQATFSVAAPPEPGLTLRQSAGSTVVTEGGGTDTYTVVLDTQPTAEVQVNLTVGDHISVNTTQLVFDATNWNIPQTVTVTAINDTLPEGTQTSGISHSITSSDPDYSGLTPLDLNLTVNDNDVELAGLVWNDANGDSNRTSDEPGLEGWTVYLDTNQNGQLDDGETSTLTSGDGRYRFTDLRPGTYTVAQVLQDGWEQTYPTVAVTTTNAQIPIFTPTLNPVADGETQINFSAANYTVNEDGTAVTEIVVTRSGKMDSTVSATLTFAEGTAEGCSCSPSSTRTDFNQSPITVTFAANETRKVIAVENALFANPDAIRIRDDSKAEGSEYFSIELTNPTGGATIGQQGSATVTILDDEAPSPITDAPAPEPTDTGLTASSTNSAALINLDDFWQDSRFTDIKGSGFTSVIIDTGIDLDHPFFGPDSDGDGIADRIVYQYDFADNDADASDKNGHGSHVASIIGSGDSTYSGIAPEADIVALKVFKDSGTGSFSDLEESLQWVINNASTYNIASVNLSLGDERNWTTAETRYGIGDELAALASMGIVTAAAAGNNFAQFGSALGVAYPAADPNTIGVGAVLSQTDQIADFSQRHPELSDIFAPGIPIIAADANGGTRSLGGTSQAAPHIAGIAVLAQQIATETLGRKLTVSEFQTLLLTTGVTINDGDDEVDSVVNTGLNFLRVDMQSLAEGILTLDAETPDSGIGSVDNDSTDDPIFIPKNSLGAFHRVTFAPGDVIEDVDFGNQQLQADLIATAFDVVTDHVLGGAATFTYTLENQGLWDAGTFEVDVVYSNDDIIGNADDIVVDKFEISGLAAGDILTGTLDIQLPVANLNANALAEDPAGQGSDYISNNVDYVGLVVDSMNVVSEFSELNNINQGKGIDKDDITYFPWDIDGSGQVTPSDAIYVINRLGQTTTAENALADFDGSGQITPSDAISAINRLGYSLNTNVIEGNA
jgi:hypothetical protein